MNIRISLLAVVVALASVLLSCQKEEVQAVIQPGAAPVLSIDNAAVVLTEDQDDQTVLTMSWGATSYGFKAAVSYSLDFAVAGTDFLTAESVTVGPNLSFSYTGAELNNLALLLGLAPGSAGTIDVRLNSDVNPNVESLVAEVKQLTVTPYLQFVEYPALYVPGNYQNWTPDQAATVVSVEDDMNYEGFVYFPDPDVEFKFTDAPNWDNGIFGDESGGSTGVLASPGDNIRLAEAGYYRIRANLADLTWTADKTDWGLIGSATPGGWDADQDMEYNEETQTWGITLDLVAGEMKFRANDDWGINLGDNDTDLTMEYDGANIPVEEDGNYSITLNIAVGGNYTYSVRKN
ncbi:MAG: SusE domain-containing protein [Bacteroidota bacterium]